MTNFNGQHRYGQIEYQYWAAVKHQTYFTAIELAQLFTYASSSGIRTAIGKKIFPKPTIKSYSDNANGTNLWDNTTITKEIERREKINKIMLKAIADIQSLSIA